jgi:hypothetical protein
MQWQPRYAMSVGIVSLLLVLGGLWFWTTRGPNQGRNTASHTNLSSNEASADSEIEPSISNYQVVANRSFEKLDQLLTTQGTKTAPSLPIYTASTLSISKDLE